MFLCNDKIRLAEIFPIPQLPAFKAYIDYDFGEIWCTNSLKSTSYMLLSGSFVYLFGEPNIQLIKNLSTNSKVSKLTLIPLNTEWGKYLINQKSVNLIHKYRYRTNLCKFNEKIVRETIDNLKLEIRFMEINDSIFNEISHLSWCKTLCILFADYNKFKKLGSGFVAFRNDEIISCAMSYFVYSQGIEITVATQENYRNLGLATICAGKLIKKNMTKGLYCNWDATSLNSLNVAIKLGYILQEQYDAFYYYLE